MLAEKLIRLEKIDKKDIDKEILRWAIIAELDAVSFYEQMAAMTENKILRKVMLEVAREEKMHVGEFQALLLREDGQQGKELEQGKKEVDELTK